MNKILVSAIAGTAFVAGAIGSVIVLKEVPEEVIAEKYIDTFVKSPIGKRVRVVGVKDKRGYVEKEDDDTKEITVATLNDKAICNVMIDAPILPISEGNKVSNIPAIEELKDYFIKVQPFLIPGSCNENGMCLWNALLKGKLCYQISSHPSYVGSTMQDFLNLPVSMKKRFLKTKGIKVNPEGQTEENVLPYGDPGALINEEYFVGHEWLDRKDLNYMKTKNKEAPKRSELIKGIGDTIE